MAVLGLSVDPEEGATESPFAFLSRTRGGPRGGDVQDSSSHVGVRGFQQHCSFCVQAGVRCGKLGSLRDPAGGQWQFQAENSRLLTFVQWSAHHTNGPVRKGHEPRHIQELWQDR